MSYLIQNIDRYVISDCINNDRQWRRVKPWWFSSPTATAIAWSVFKYNKANGYPPSASVIPSLIDYEKSNITNDEVVQYLRCDQIDSKEANNLLLTFEATGKLMDIIERHFKSPIANSCLEELRSIVDVLKVEPFITVPQYQIINNKWNKWKNSNSKN